MCPGLRLGRCEIRFWACIGKGGEDVRRVKCERGVLGVVAVSVLWAGIVRR
jgi:hypothetical protein